MPIIGTTAYTTVEGTLTLARAIVNDMLTTQAGDILTDGAPFTFPMLNAAADFAEKELANHGMLNFTKETVLSPITPVGITDPGIQVNISDSGYFDGVLNFNPPMLPEDLLVPTRLWERHTASNEQWIPMTEIPDGLPSVTQTTRLGMWEWRQDAIYMPGSVFSNDLRLRYTSIGLQFITPNDVIQVRGLQTPLAWLTASIFVNARDKGAGATLEATGKEGLKQISNMNTRARQGETITRVSYGRQRQKI